MYNASPTFIENIQKTGRQIDVRISFDEVVLNGDDIYSLEKQFNADFFRTTMQQVEGRIKGRYNLDNKVLKVEVGVKYGTGVFEYVDLGNFNVAEHERIVGATSEQDQTTFKAFDDMIKTHKTYEVSSVGLAYPASVGDLFNAICGALDITVGDVSNMINQTQIIDEELYANVQNATYRNVLDDISQASGVALMFSNNLLIAKTFGTSVATIFEDNMRSLSMKDNYSGINVLSLTREPQHDNYVYPEDFELIPIDDRVEIVFADNQIMDKKRELFAPTLLASMSGIDYYPFESDTSGLVFLEPLDTITIVDMDNVSHIGLTMHSRLVITSGIKETVSATKLMNSKEQYALVTDTRKDYSKVALLVDKQNAKITSSVEELRQTDEDNFETLTTNIIQTAQSIIDQVAENYVTTGELGVTETTIINRIETEATQTLQTFSQITQSVENVDGKYTTKFDELQTYVRTSIDGLELGEINSPLKLKLSNNRISFIENGKEVAFISDSALNITDGAFFTSLRIGDFEWKREDDGSVSFGKVG